MQMEHVVVATVTLARDADEDALLRSALASLSAAGLPFVVCDGGSGPDFVEFLRSLRGCTVVPSRAPGLVGQVEASLAAASERGGEHVFYAESDKREFFERHLVDFLRSADAQAGVVLAARSDASFRTFPAVQRFTERTINELCGDFIGAAGDYSYGPCLIRRPLVPYVKKLDASVGWGWRPFVFALARRLGYEVRHVVGDFACPPEQREEDERERLHRLRQLRQNVDGLILAQTMPL